MHASSPFKHSSNAMPVARLGSALDRNIPSPNGRRDPSTPSRIVRSTRTPPTSAAMTQLPPLEIARSPEYPLHASPVRAPQLSGDDVIDEVVPTASMYETAPRRDQSALEAPPYEEEFDSDSLSDDETLPAQPSGQQLGRSAGVGDTEPPTEPQPCSVSPIQKGLTLASAAASGEVRRSGSKRPVFNIRVEKKERIGRGTFGDVFRALDLDNDTEIAVKEIVVAQDFNKDLEKQIHVLEREIRVMQKLDHPNTVKYLGAKRMSDTLNIYMEYVSGGTVASQLRSQGHFSEESTRRYTRQLLEGLDYLHGKKIAHRDLKGDNLFLTKDDVLKVGDFGTSKELQTLRVTDSVAGTPNFMAPEVISCSGHSFQADIWSVGCCIIQMLVGKPPFSNMDNHMAVMFAVMKGHIEAQIPKDGVTPSLEDFLRKCLQTNPKDRPTTKELLQHPWIREGCAMDCDADVVIPPPPSAVATVSPARRIHDAASAAAAMERCNAVAPTSEPQRAQHPPNIIHRPPPCRGNSAGSCSEATRSPPPSAGSRPSSTNPPDGRSFLARFPRHNPLDASAQRDTKSPPPHHSDRASPGQPAPTQSLPGLNSAGRGNSGGNATKSSLPANGGKRLKRQPSTTVRR